MTQFNRVLEFNKTVLGIQARKHGLQDGDELQLSLKQLREECSEYESAYEDALLSNEDKYIDAIDAIMDLKIFADGILYKLGLNEEEVEDIHTIIMNANMAKKIGVKKGREGFSAADAVKPEGWIAPEKLIKDLIFGA